MHMALFPILSSNTNIRAPALNRNSCPSFFMKDICFFPLSLTALIATPVESVAVSDFPACAVRFPSAIAWASFTHVFDNLSPTAKLLQHLGGPNWWQSEWSKFFLWVVRLPRRGECVRNENMQYTWSQPHGAPPFWSNTFCSSMATWLRLSWVRVYRHFRALDTLLLQNKTCLAEYGPQPDLTIATAESGYSITE